MFTRPKSEVRSEIGLKPTPSGPVRDRPTQHPFRVLVAVTVLSLLAACTGPMAALSLVPWTPLLSATLATRGGSDLETRKLLNNLQAKGDWPGVIRLAQTHLQNDPANANWLLVLGYARLETGDYPGAIEVLSAATKISPEEIDAWNVLGEAQRRLGSPERAMQTLQRAMNIDASSPVSPYLLGEIYRETGRCDQAVGVYRRSIQLEGTYSPAWYGAGLCYIAQGRRGELEEVQAALSKLDPGMARDLQTRAAARK